MHHRTEQEIMQNWKGNLDRPVVSVCCATYNHVSYIAEAIDGFLIQETDFPFEVLINDDCSTDETAQIIIDYEKKYPNIIKPIYQNENQYSKGIKPNSTFNFPRAKGKYIALCEGDDYWTDSSKLQMQVDFLEENISYVITYSSVEAFDVNGNIDSYNGGATYDLNPVELQKAPSINTLTVCFRNVLQKLPPEFQCTKFGDLFLWSLLGAYGKGKFLHDIKPARYRIHAGGIFSTKSVEHKLKMGYLTSFALYSYYLRINNIEMRDYFHKKSTGYSFQIYGRIYYIIAVLKSIIRQFVSLGKSL